MPAVKPLLQKVIQALEPLKELFYCRSIVGMQSFSCRAHPNICAPTHQASRFLNLQKETCVNAIQCVIKCLLGEKDKFLLFIPDFLIE